MIQDTWPRVASIWCQDNGDKTGVWLAHDKSTGTVHLVDAVLWRQTELLLVVADSYNARGGFIPVAWLHKDKPIVDQLQLRGVNVCYYTKSMPQLEFTPAFAEAMLTELKTRMREGRFKGPKRLKLWADEANAMFRGETALDLSAAPMIAATCLALASLDHAKAAVKKATSKAGGLYQKVAMI